MKKITISSFEKLLNFKFLFVLFFLLCLSLQTFGQITYTQNFSTTGHGWTTAQFSRTTTNICTTTGSLRRNLYSSATTGITASPTIGASNGGLVTLSYQYKIIEYSGGAATPNNFGSFKVQYSTDNTNWFDIAGSTVSTDHIPSTTCATKTLNFSLVPSTNTYIRFNASWATGDYYLYFDEVSVSQGAAPSCIPPSGFTSSAVTSNSATILWNPASPAPATGYEYYYSDVNVAPAAAGTATVGLTSNLSGLSANTMYYVWLRSDCGGSFSSWNGPFTFRTLCDSFSVPFSEGFNSTSTSESCWTVLNVNADADAWDLNYATTPIEGNQSAMLYTDGNGGANNDWLISPRITLTGNQRLVFKYKVQSSFEPNDFRVLLSTTGNAPANFTTELASLASYSNTTPETMALDLSGVSGDVFFAWHVPSGGLDGWRVYVDDIVVEDIPAVAPGCVAITSPTNGALNVMNSIVTWASDLNATGYRISVGSSSGATDVLNNFDVGNVLSYSFPTDSGSTYYVTVFPYNTFGQATGCTEINFTTCDALSVPHLETFSTFLPSCWQAADNGNLTTGPATFGTSSWAADGFGNTSGTGAFKINIDFTGDNDWVISPVVNIPSTGYELKFDAAVTQWNGTVAPTTPWEADDFVEVLVSTSGLNNWTVLYTYNNTNVPAPTGATNVINLNAYAGLDVRFAFRGVEGAADGGADVDFFIDNFEVRLTPASVPVCATNVVATPNATCGNFANTITWDAVAGADGYNITIGTTTGGNNIANNVNLGNVLSYSFSGNANTTYYFTISPYNGVGPATGCSEVSFTTSLNGCYCIPTYTNGGTGDNITNVAIGSWSNASTGNVSPYYEDFTTQQPAPIAIPTLTAGLNSTVAVTMGTDGTQYSRVWVDFNQNLTFEPSESFSLGTSAGGSGTSNIIVNVPAGATLGFTRMRIRGGDDAAILNTQACGASSSTYGQTEDYLVNILAAPACLPPTGLTATSVTASSANLGWTEAGTATVWDVEWGTFGFTPTGTPTITNSTNTQPISSLSPNTTYSFYVRANCGAGGYSTWSGPFSFTTSCVADNVPYTQNFESATVPALPSCTTQQNVGTGNLWTVQNNPGYGFTTKALRYAWNSSSDANVWFYTNGINLVGGTTYKITYDYGGTGTTFPEKLKVSYGNSANAAAMTTLLADHPNVNSSTPVNNIVNFTPATSGVYYFGFNAYSDADQFYLFVDNIVVDVALSNSDFDNSNFLAYPNPVRDIFNISYTTEISSIRVINMIGQEVISKTINATSSQVDMSQLSAGTYIVNVTVGDSVKTLKVVKQ